MTNKTSEEFLFTGTHEWVCVCHPETNEVAVGLSDHAQHLLGDIVFITLPKEGSVVGKSQDCGVVESVKSASDIYSPVSGKVTAVNEDVIHDPQKINQDPYNSWLFKVALTNPEELKMLMTKQKYQENTDGNPDRS